MMGLFLAMPRVGGVKAICFHVPGWRPWANLIGADDDDLSIGAEADKAPARLCRRPPGDGHAHGRQRPTRDRRRPRYRKGEFVNDFRFIALAIAC